MEIKTKDKTTLRAIELVKKDKKELKNLHIVDWLQYLDKAEILVRQETIYDSFKRTNER